MKNSAPTNYPPTFIIKLARFISFTASKLLWRIKYHNKENIPQNLESGLLIVSNHPTYFDPFWICAPINRKFRFMAWDQAFDWFLVGWLIRYLGAFPINTKTGRSKNAMREALKSLKEGATLVVFPEGVREFSDGKLLEFKTGAIRIALEANVPILPVTVRGGNKIWAQDIRYPHLGRKVEIIYHPLFKVEKPAENKNLRRHFEKETARIVEIIKSEL